MKDKKKKIIIFDTTLRDGEQSPGASLTVDEKILIARQLERMGVDVIEGGFPISSPGDYASVERISSVLKKSSVCGLARSVQKDIDAAAKALKKAKHPRIHVFLATSKIHMKYKLKKLKAEVIDTAEWAVKHARKKMTDIEFSPEDASRSERDFLFKVIEKVIKAGARTVNIPDTVGYSVPEEFGSLIADIMNNVPNINKAVISVHCHNDLGLAVANSISAVCNGAGQIECTVNGIGERAGNASMEEIVMAFKTRKDLYPYITGINSKEIYNSSKMVSKLTGIMVQPNKAIVGSNAFSHESGIHQDGVLKKRTTYEIISPKDIGLRESHLVLGKHSGRHAFRERLKKLGYVLTENELNKAFERFKKLADKKKAVFDDDLEAVVEDEITHIPQTYILETFKVISGNSVEPNATLTVIRKGKRVEVSSDGDGPVDACYKAIDKLTGLKMELQNYQISSVTHGKDAMGEVSVQVKSGTKAASGKGASTDVIEASIKAYLNAVNRLVAKDLKKKRLSL